MEHFGNYLAIISKFLFVSLSKSPPQFDLKFKILPVYDLIITCLFREKRPKNGWLLLIFFSTRVRPIPEYYVYFVFVVNAAAAGSSKTPPPPPRATHNVPLMMTKLPES